MTVDREAECAALGHVVLRVRVLEHTAYDIARALGVPNPDAKQVSVALRNTQKLAMLALPPWSQNVTATELVEWIAGALTVFDERNQLVHWRHEDRRTAGEWVPVATSPRTGYEVQARSVDGLRELARQADDAYSAGQELWQELLLQEPSGVFRQFPAFARSEEVRTSYIFEQRKGCWSADALNDEDRRRSFETFMSSIPHEWWLWAKDRLEVQRK